MIARQCSTSRVRLPAVPDLGSTWAVLPAFLVPSLASTSRLSATPAHRAQLTPTSPPFTSTSAKGKAKAANQDEASELDTPTVTAEPGTRQIPARTASGAFPTRIARLGWFSHRALAGPSRLGLRMTRMAHSNAASDLSRGPAHNSHATPSAPAPDVVGPGDPNSRPPLLQHTHNQSDPQPLHLKSATQSTSSLATSDEPCRSAPSRHDVLPRSSPPPRLTSRASALTARPVQSDSPFNTIPTNRSELMSLLSIPTPDPLPPDHLLALRQHILNLGYLDDPGPVSILAGFAAFANQPTFAFRFLSQAVKAMATSHRSPAAIATAVEGPVVKLARRQAWDEVLALTSQAAKLGVRSERMTGARVKALYARGRVREVPAEVARLDQPSGDAFDDLIGAFLRTGQVKKAQDALASKAEAGHSTTIRTALVLLDGNWALNGNYLMEQKLLEQATKTQLADRLALRQQPSVLNKIMAARANRGDFDHALEVLDHFDLRAGPRLALPYADAPPASLRTVETAKEHLPTPWYWQPEPDLRTLIVLANLAVGRGRADCALVMIAQAVEGGVEVTPKLAAALIRALTSYGKLDQAERLFFMLPELELHGPKGRSAVFIWELGVRIKLRKLESRPVVLKALLTGILNQRGLAGARTFLERVAAVEARPPQLSPGLVDAFVVYLTRHESGLSPAVAATLLWRLRNLDSSVRRPTVRHLNALLAASWRRQRFAKPTRSTRRKGKLAASAKEREVMSVLPLPDQASRVEAKPPPGPVSRLRQSLADRGVFTGLPETTEHVLRIQAPNLSSAAMWDYVHTQLVDNAVSPTRHHLVLILAAHFRDGDASGALASLHKGLSLGVEPHVSLYSVIVGGLARLGQLNMARGVYAEMKELGIMPDRGMYAALALASARRRDVPGFLAVVAEAEARLPEAELGARPLARDPVFVTLHYQALVASRKVLPGLVLLRRRLRQGLVPDQALRLVARRTRRWLRWKHNQTLRAGRGGRAALLASVGSANLAKVERYAVAVDAQVARIVRRQASTAGWRKEVGRIVDVWAAAPGAGEGEGGEAVKRVRKLRGRRTGRTLPDEWE